MDGTHYVKRFGIIGRQIEVFLVVYIFFCDIKYDIFEVKILFEIGNIYRNYIVVYLIYIISETFETRTTDIQTGPCNDADS